MSITFHKKGTITIAELQSTSIAISSVEEGLNLIGDLYYQNVDCIILHRENLSEQFFDLKTGFAGELLQKFSNYRMRLAIVGELSSYSGKALTDFILECNRGQQTSFVESVEEVFSKHSPN